MPRKSCSSFKNWVCQSPNELRQNKKKMPIFLYKQNVPHHTVIGGSMQERPKFLKPLLQDPFNKFKMPIFSLIQSLFIWMG